MRNTAFATSSWCASGSQKPGIKSSGGEVQKIKILGATIEAIGGSSAYLRDESVFHAIGKVDIDGPTRHYKSITSVQLDTRNIVGEVEELVLWIKVLEHHQALEDNVDVSDIARNGEVVRD